MNQYFLFLEYHAYSLQKSTKLFWNFFLKCKPIADLFPIKCLIFVWPAKQQNGALPKSKMYIKCAKPGLAIWGKNY